MSSAHGQLPASLSRVGAGGTAWQKTFAKSVGGGGASGGQLAEAVGGAAATAVEALIPLARCLACHQRLGERSITLLQPLPQAS